MKQILMIIMTWLITIATAQAQSGLNVSPLFEGKIIPTQRMVETRVKGKMLSKYQLNFFRSVRFKANNKQEINRVHDLIELDIKKNPGFAYGENYSSKKSHSKETFMLQLPKQGNQNRFHSPRQTDNRTHFHCRFRPARRKSCPMES